MATSAMSDDLSWRNQTRELSFDGSSRNTLKLEFLIVDLPNGDQFRLACQGTGKKFPVFQVLLRSSDARKAPLTLRLTEGGTEHTLNLGPLVYRQLEGIRAPVPAGLLDRMVKADRMRFSINNGLHWHHVTADSTAAVLPELSCYKNN